MDDDCEKSLGKPEELLSDAVLVDDSLLGNENSNGVMEDGMMVTDELNAFGPSADYDESNSQSYPVPAFDSGDDVGFQDNSTNDGELSEVPPIINDLSPNDDSNSLPCRESAVNTRSALDEIETGLNDFEVPAMEDHSKYGDKDVPPSDYTQNEADEEMKLVDEVLLDQVPVEVPIDETPVLEIPVDNTPNNDALNEIPGNETPGELAPVAETSSVDTPVDEMPGEITPIDKVPAVKTTLDETPTKEKAVTMGQEADTEVVSEDELPAVEKPRVQDAENVSDDELPGPRAAELPADTEVVSEDELPATNKRESGDADAGSAGRKRKPDEQPQSPGSDTDQSSKKQAVTKNGESKPVPAEKRSSTEEKEKKKKALPELDKYWKVVNEDSSDFTGWTYLLQYVDQESDVEAAREAYDAFLSHYPYCYGYWRKYADYEKRKGSKKKCFEVLERGLKAIPLSVDLWIHYLNHIKSTKGEELAYVRQQYDRAIEACGLEFRSDRLWESYIKWETEHGTPLHVTNVYDRLLATPTLGYTAHFDNFQEHIMSESVAALVSREELVRVRSEVRDGNTVLPPAADLPPGEDEPDDHIASEEEAQAMKERIIAARRKVHKATGEQVAQRWTFEEGIKRPYFHVKPLERSQLKNWKNYLEWEKQHGSFRRALVLHERCLIACALYEEFWLRLVKFLEEAAETDSGLVSVEREALERACTVHHPDKPALHVHWAYFEEVHGNAARAAEILERLDKTCPNLLQVAYRRINLERRRGDLDKSAQLYESYISNAKNKAIATALSIKYARFLQRWRSDTDGAQRVLAEAIARDPLAYRLYLQQLDIALHTPGATFQQMSGYLEAYERVEGADLEMCGAMAARRLELAEELGSDVEARAAYNHQRAVERRLSKRSRQAKHDTAAANESSTQKKKESVSSASSNAGTGPAAPANISAPPPGPAPPHGSYYTPTAAAPPQPYDQPSYQQQYQPQWNHYQQQGPNPYQHQHPWGQYPNYY